MVSVAEYVTTVGMSQDAILEAIHAGRVPSVRLGRVHRIPRWSLESVLAGRDPKAMPAPAAAN